jgi:hypothetical protein
MKRLSLIVLVAFAGLTVWTVGCGGGSPPPGESASPAAAEEAGQTGSPAATPATPESAGGALTGTLSQSGDRPRLVAAVRGVAEMGYVRPRTRREKGFVVTTFQLKNLAKGPIAGLRVDEFWYDKEGNTVTGDRYRHRQPFMPGEVITVELRVPTNPAMDRPIYNFSHQNGEIKTVLLDKIDAPSPAKPSQ